MRRLSLEGRPCLTINTISRTMLQLGSDGYDKLGVIGKGSNATVFKCKCRVTGELVAIKKLHFELESEDDETEATDEYLIQRRLKHPCIVKLIEIFAQKLSIYLVFELLDIDLYNYVNSTRYCRDKVKSLMSDLFRGLAYCHDLGVVHCDLSPANVLVSKQGTLKIADFGSALTTSACMRYNPQGIEPRGTLWYRAPELLMDDCYFGLPIDVWAAGLIVVFAYKRYPLFKGDSEIDELYKIFRALGSPTEEIWPGFTKMKNYKRHFPKWPAPKNLYRLLKGVADIGIDMLQRVFVYNPSRRATVRQCLDHPFFALYE